MISERTGISREHIYRFAKRYNLPTNAPFKPGTHRYYTMCEALVCKVSIKTLAEAYRVTPSVIKAALRKGPPPLRPRAQGFPYLRRSSPRK